MRISGLFLALACAPKTPGATTPAAAHDVASVAARVAASLPGWEGFAAYDDPPRIVVQPSTNHTKYDVPSTLATARLVNGLVQAAADRYDVIDPATWASWDDKARSRAEGGGLLVLQSDIRATPSDAGLGRPAVEVLITYRLVEADTARAVWAADFEWTKVKGRDGYVRVSTAPPALPASPASPAAPVVAPDAEPAAEPRPVEEPPDPTEEAPAEEPATGDATASVD